MCLETHYLELCLKNIEQWISNAEVQQKREFINMTIIPINL